METHGSHQLRPLPAFLANPAGKDVLIREAKLSRGESINHPKDMRAMGNVPCIVGAITDDDAQKSEAPLPLGSLRRIDRTNTVLFLSLHAQRPLVNLRFKSDRGDRDYQSTIMFDPEYLRSISVTFLNATLEDAAAVEEEFQVFQKLSRTVVFDSGTSVSLPIPADELITNAQGQVIRVQVELQHLDNPSRAWSLYEQSVSNQRLHGPVKTFKDKLVQQARYVVIYLAIPKVNNNCVLENMDFLSLLLELRQTMVPIGRTAHSNFFPARHVYWEEALNHWNEYQKFWANEQPTPLPPWLRIPNQDKAQYAFAYSAVDIKNQVFFNPHQLIGVLAQGIMWDIAHNTDVFERFYGPRRRYHVERVSGRSSDTAIFKLRIEGLRLGELPPMPRSGQGAKLFLHDEFDRHGQPLSFEGKIYISNDTTWPLQLVHVGLRCTGSARYTGWLDLDAESVTDIEKLRELQVMHHAEPNCHRAAQGEDLIGFQLVKTCLGRIEDLRRSPNFLRDHQVNPSNSQAQIEEAMDDIDLMISHADADQAAYIRAALTGVPGAIAALDGYEGCGKTLTQSRLFYAFARLGMQVLVVTHSNTAADVAIQSYIRLNNELDRPRHRAGQIIRWYAPEVERTLELREEFLKCRRQGNLPTHERWEKVQEQDARVPANLRPFSTSCTIGRLTEQLSQHNDIPSQQYLKLRTARFRGEIDLTVPPRVVIEDLRERFQQEILNTVQVVFTTASQAPHIAHCGFRPSFISIDEASTVSMVDAIHALGSFHRVPLVGIAGDTRQLSHHIRSSREGMNPYGLVLEHSILESWPDANTMLRLYPSRYNYRQVRELFDLSNTLFYEGKMLIGAGMTLREHTSLSSSVRRALEQTSLFRGALRVAASRDRRLIVLNVNSTDEKITTGSRFNIIALRVAATLLGHLSQQGVFQYGTAKLITPYAADRDVWPQALRDTGYPGLSVQAATIDSMQGDQADVVVANLVRGCVQEHPFGILEHKRRLNVLSSRGKQYMVYICNLDAWRNCKTRYPKVDKQNPNVWALKEYLEANADVIRIPLELLN